MTQKEWITVKEAATLVRKSPRTIYEWIDDGRLHAQHDETGRMIVLRKAILRIAPSVRRGRPRAS